LSILCQPAEAQADVAAAWQLGLLGSSRCA